ncbi:putative phage protein p10 [Candidatus Termititenax aidoneus]|uniref:Phage protein p10 n=1 Tax=Termititenax aidoneus TaxID=2218524 RepID=A0A388T8C8_TERA1|nr:putative phage protein p10 [Candidatus Termititenax aidoneus]
MGEAIPINTNPAAPATPLETPQVAPARATATTQSAPEPVQTFTKGQQKLIDANKDVPVIESDSDYQLDHYWAEFQKQSAPVMDNYKLYLSKDRNTSNIQRAVYAINQAAANRAKPIVELEGGQDYLDYQSEQWQWIMSSDSSNIDYWQAKGPMKAGEVFARFNKWELIPVFGTGYSLGKNYVMKSLFDKLYKNEELTMDELYTLRKFRDDMMEIEARGMSIGGKITSGIMNTVPFLGEMAVIALTSGTAAPAVAAKGAGTAAVKGTATAATKGLLSRNAAKAGQWALRAAKATANPTMWPRTLNNGVNYMLNDSFYLTDKGALLYKESKMHPATALVKGIGSTWASIFSEYAGEYMLDPIAGGMISKINPVFLQNFQKALKTTGAGKAFEVMRKAGMNGIAGEEFEEVFEGWLTTALRLDNKKGFKRTFDDYMEAMFPQSAEDALVELGILAVPGMVSTGTMALVARTARSIEREKGRPITDEELKEVVKSVKSVYESDIDEINLAWEKKETAEDIASFEESFKGYTQEMEAAGLTDEEVGSNSLLIQNFVEAAAIKTGRTRTEILNGWLGEDRRQSLKVPNVRRLENETTAQYEQRLAAQESLGQPMLNARMTAFGSSNFTDFYKWAENNTDKKNKKYFEYRNNNLDLDIPEDIIKHDKNKHGLSAAEIKNVLANIKIPERAVFNNKSSIGGQAVLLKVNTGSGDYGVVLETFPKRNIVTTIFKSTGENGVDAWLNKNGGVTQATAPSENNPSQSGQRADNLPVASPFTPLTDIIAQTRANIDKFDDKDIADVKRLYQSQPNTEKLRIAQEAIDWAFQSAPIAKTTGTEWPGISKKELVAKVWGYFQKTGTQIERSDFGTINLTKQGTRDSVYHGIGREKISAFVAVPEIIKNGKIFSQEKNYKGRMYDAALLVAPIEIAGEKYIATLVVKTRNGFSTYYLHEVEKESELKKELLTDTRAAEAHESIIAKNLREASANLSQGRRGFYNPSKNLITLLKDADRSTFLHESAHYFLEFYLRYLPQELDAVFKFAHVQNKPLNQLSDAEYRQMQEAFAVGFETWLMEGRAPNERLANAFARFKEWLTEIYESIKNLLQQSGLKIELSEDIRAFYAGMFNRPDAATTIDSSLTYDRNMNLYQDAVKKLEEINKKKKALKEKYGAAASPELAEVEQLARDLEIVITNLKPSSMVEGAEEAWRESPLSQVQERKVYIDPNSDIKKELQVIPPQWRTEETTGARIDELADELGLTQNELLAEIAKNPSKRDFVERYVREKKNELARDLQEQFADETKVIGEITPELADMLSAGGKEFVQTGAIILKQEDFEHIKDRHEKQIKELGFDNINDFIDFVLKNVDAVYLANNAYNFVTKQTRQHDSRVLLELNFNNENKLYEIKTAHPFRDNFFKEKEPLWESRAYSPARNSDSQAQPNGSAIHGQTKEPLRERLTGNPESFRELTGQSDQTNYTAAAENSKVDGGALDFTAVSMEALNTEREAGNKGFAERATDQLKKRLNEIARGLREGALNEKLTVLQLDVIRAIKDSPIDAAYKIKLLDKLKKADNDYNRKFIFNGLYRKEAEYWKRIQKETLDKEIHRLLRSTKPKISSRGITLHGEEYAVTIKGKYQAEYETLFRRLRKIGSMNRTDAMAELTKLEAEPEPEIEGYSKEHKLEKLALGWTAFGLNYPVEGFQELKERIEEEIGNAEKGLADMRSELENARDEQVKEISKLKSNAQKDSVGAKARNWAIAHLADTSGVLEMIGGKKLAERYGINNLQVDKEVSIYETFQENLTEIAKILNGRGEVSRKDIKNTLAQFDQWLGDDNYELIKAGRKTSDGKLSKMHLMDMYNACKNEDTRLDYNKAYGPDMVSALLANLSEKEKAVADYLMEYIDEKLKPIEMKQNLKQYGLPLALRENYWPATSEHAIREAATVKTDNMTAKSQKTKLKYVVPVPANMWLKYNSHVNEIMHQKVMYDTWDRMRKIFGNIRVQDAIKDTIGEFAAKKIMDEIHKLSLNANLKEVSKAGEIFNKFFGAVAATKVLGNISVAFKQVSSMTGYLQDMPTGQFIKGITEFARNYKAAVKYMQENSKYIESRFHQGADQVTKALLSDSAFKELLGKIPKLGANLKTAYQDVLEILSFPLRAGDIGSVYIGGYAYVQYLQKEQKLSNAEAFKKFEDITVKTQQAGYSTSLSSWQTEGVFKIFTVFKNQQVQQVRNMANAVLEYYNGEIASNDLIRIITANTIVNAALISLISALWNKLGSDDDDKTFGEEFLTNFLNNLIDNPLAVLPLLGDVLAQTDDIILATLQGKKAPYWARTPSMLLVGDIYKSGTSIMDILSGMGDMKDASNLLTLLGEVGAGLPVGNISRQIKKGVNIYKNLTE